MNKIRVGVLRGGPSSEYEISLKTGGNVLKSLPEKYSPIDIFIDKEGVWHIQGIPHKPHETFKKVDVVFNALHGEYGEDGKVQKILDTFSIPYTGSKTLPSAIGMNKALAKNIFKSYGIKTPYYKVESKSDDVGEIASRLFNTFPMPAVVKPIASGSSVGVSIAYTFQGLQDALSKAFEYSDKALVEEYIKGREATCGVVDKFRGNDFYSLLPIEIIKPEKSDFFDYEAKYCGGSQEICPGNFSQSEKEAIQNLAIKAHKVLGLRHYSRSDFIISPRRGIYILEVNTLPGLTAESLLPKSLQAVGCSLPDFLDHLITLALAGN